MARQENTETTVDDMPAWRIYHGDGSSHDGIAALPKKPPRWRSFGHDVPKPYEWVSHPTAGWPREARQYHERSGGPAAGERLSGWSSRPDTVLEELGRNYRVTSEEVQVAVNTAIQLRRPLLVTGDPGTGKTVLAYSIAYELKLGPVLRWNITSRSTLQDGLYSYDVLDRVNDTALRNAQKRSAGGEHPGEQDDIGNYLTLGPLGDALLPRARPRLLLIDELDKSDIDLPNDLLHILENGTYSIPELRRISVDSKPQWVLSADGSERVPIFRGQVHCAEFPVVIMTSNREREFPPAFQRRCIRVGLEKMDGKQLEAMARGYFDQAPEELSELVGIFTTLRDGQNGQERRLATDQLLNLIYLRTRQDALTSGDRQSVIDTVLQSLDEG